MPDTIFAHIFLFVVISMAVSASISLIWTIFYLLFRRNILVGLKLFYASFIGGTLGSIPGLLISILVILICLDSKFYYDLLGLFAILFYSFIPWILGVLLGAFWAGSIILKDYQR